MTIPEYIPFSLPYPKVSFFTFIIKNEFEKLYLKFNNIFNDS